MSEIPDGLLWAVECGYDGRWFVHGIRYTADCGQDYLEAEREHYPDRTSRLVEYKRVEPSEAGR
jgi:hypothetical protein